ncbi:hypothetical protein NC653_008508 [Populus alba x Populus x berolinensis]|uniref:Uncharacterized protein n=1 Tax=Populus alba x Populus x berolinensis TaxID=444605 RepID=A0AAD6W8I0_9ROSI|nr:hypothetical protein NC653_008508 [Populus alba x Populus x berolinensis]
MSRVLKLPSSIVADHVDVSCPIPLPIRSHRTADGDHGQLQKSLSSKNGFHPEGEALFNYFNPSMSFWSSIGEFVMLPTEPRGLLLNSSVGSLGFVGSFAVGWAVAGVAVIGFDGSVVEFPWLTVTLFVKVKQQTVAMKKLKLFLAAAAVAAVDVAAAAAAAETAAAAAAAETVAAAAVVTAAAAAAVAAAAAAAAAVAAAAAAVTAVAAAVDVIPVAAAGSCRDSSQSSTLVDPLDFVALDSCWLG